MNLPSTTPRTLRSDIVFTFALVLASAVAWVVREVLVLVYVSALFAVVLTPIVQFTSRLRIGRSKKIRTGTLAASDNARGVLHA